MSFLDELADQISSQFSLGENTDHDLNSIDLDSGKKEKYGKLGDFAKHFDQSAERRYVEEGYLRKDPYNTDPKQFEILMQEPNATVLVKKRMFSSVGENFRPDFMDKDEKLYYKAMKILFQNKCKQIAALEKLSKIQKITNAMGSVPDQLMPIIFTLSDTITSGFEEGSNLFGALGRSPLGGNPSNFIKVMDRLRRIYAFNQSSGVTTWLTDSSNLFQSQFGQGTGVIELTNFTYFTTTVSTNIDSPGRFSMTLEDPYEAMLITDYDIEKAISDATNMFYNKKIFQFSKESSDKLINDLQSRLNQIRAKRNASPISIKVDPDTLLGRRVTVILDRLGIEVPFNYDGFGSTFTLGFGGKGVSVPNEYLRGGEIAGNDGIDMKRQVFSDVINQSKNGLISPSRTHTSPDSELSIFTRLITTIYNKISQDANSRNAFQTSNELTNYARRKLRFNFAGKLIVQPMDVVHFYINSKSRWDEKLLSGIQNMFTGLGMLQNINNTLTNLANAVGALNSIGNVPLEIEKSAFVGKDFPNFLWNIVRGQFVSENEGTHVFAGVVQSATDSWSGGKFTVSINGSDNTFYFTMGKINFNPGIDVYNGTIFDPLSPFKSNFDSINGNNGEVPELLDDNKYLLGSGQGSSIKEKSLVKYKLGRYAGQLVNEDSIVQDRNFDPVTGRITKIFYAPDGLVYKWKEGIGVFTQFGTNLTINDAQKVGSPNIAKEPFAGQNVMNVLSLLVTGIPYNFATYYKAALEFDGALSDPQTKQGSAPSFYQSLNNDLIKNNTLWGNFVPFKNLVVDEESYVQALQKTATIIQRNKDLDNKIKELQNLNQAAMLADAANVFAENAQSGIEDVFTPIKAQRDNLGEQVEALIKEIADNDGKYSQQIGDDTSFDASEFIDSGRSAKEISAERRLIRRQLNFLTRRMAYNVRANEDKNLFIVDDFYDKDFDILAYEKTLQNGLRLYNNQFTSVKDKIQHVAGLLNLEVFADSQGHIRCRPPQYNRMPSSVFYRMMYLKQTLGIRVFPKFLDDIFKDKLNTLRTRIEILEDEIRLDCAILSYNTDEEAMAFILGDGATSGTGDSFAFLSDDNNNGQISDFKNLLVDANPDERDSRKSEDLVIVDKLKNKSIKISNKDIFNNSVKYRAIVSSLQNQLLSARGLPAINTESFLNNGRVDRIISRIFYKSGKRIHKEEYFIKANSKINLPFNSTIDVFKVIQELSDKIKERQKALKLFYNTLKSSKEFNYLDTDSSTTNHLITPGVYGNSNIPEVFEHMIEDETYDDYGLNSGKRYIIKRAQIKELSISENPPPWTAVEVQGQLDPSLDNDSLPPGLNGAFPAGGNGLTTAIAVDYDMWRTYGFSQTHPVPVPFLRDPISQCAPYATMLLSRNRKNILHGSVTISGNEFMQAGEVIFLEDRQMLFYVTSVKHDFTFPSRFTTTLELTYGHTPGEYIPTVTDMIGKLIYNNKDVADLTIHRQERSSREINLGVIIKGIDEDTKTVSPTIINQATPNGFTNNYSAHNSQVINNILYTTRYMLGSHNSGNNINAKIELRTYYDSENTAVDTDLRAFAEGIRQILVGESEIGLNAFTIKQGAPPKPLPAAWVADISDGEVNLHDENDRRSPSQKAIDAARNHIGDKSKSGGGISSVGNESSGGTPTASQTKNEKSFIKTALLKYIVDCWITFEPRSK